MNGQNDKRREFEGFSLDVEKKVLWRSGEIVPLPPKAVEMLIVLVKNRGEVVSKTELLAAVWGETFVEESVLSNNVYLLRKTLNELAGVKNLIQTVPRRGYRFGGKQEADDSEFVLEHHVFEQTLFEEVSGEKNVEMRAGNVIIHEKENQISSGEKSETILRKTLRPASEATTRRTQLSLLGSALLVLLLIGGFAVRQWNRAAAKTNLAEIKSIAVMPLKPIAAQESDKVLSLGLADALITQLGASQKIVVRPLSSVSQYAETEFDALAVGRNLQSDAILEGTFQRADNRLRVTARLFLVSDGRQIWAGTFDETESDVFRLQDAISKETAGALILNFNQAERETVLKRYTENVAAYQAYQRGRYLYFRRGEEEGNLDKSFAEFEQAIRLDANYALAYTGLADAYARRANNSSDAEIRRQSYERAKELAQKAIALDPNLAEAYAALGWINRIYDWNWTESETNLRRAIELAPNVWNHHRLYAYLLITLGRTGEAVEVNARAKQLNPLQSDGWILYCDRQFEESAAESLKQMQVLNAADVRHDLALAYVQLGKFSEAVEIFEQLLAKKPDSFKVQSALVIAYLRAGSREKAERLLRDLEEKADSGAGRFVRLANVYSEMGLSEKAIAALQNGLKTRDDRMMWIKINPHFDNLRDDARFQEILRRMNL